MISIIDRTLSSLIISHIFLDVLILNTLNNIIIYLLSIAIISFISYKERMVTMIFYMILILMHFGRDLDFFIEDGNGKNYAGMIILSSVFARPKWWENFLIESTNAQPLEAKIITFVYYLILLKSYYIIYISKGILLSLCLIVPSNLLMGTKWLDPFEQIFLYLSLFHVPVNVFHMYDHFHTPVMIVMTITYSICWILMGKIKINNEIINVGLATSIVHMIVNRYWQNKNEFPINY